LQRKAQFYIDLLISENSMGFHADQLGETIGRGDQFLPRGSVGIKEEVERRR
jgi:hypothetical protein